MLVSLVFALRFAELSLIVPCRVFSLLIFFLLLLFLLRISVSLTHCRCRRRRNVMSERTRAHWNQLAHWIHLISIQWDFTEDKIYIFVGWTNLRDTIHWTVATALHIASLLLFCLCRRFGLCAHLYVFQWNSQLKTQNEHQTNGERKRKVNNAVNSRRRKHRRVRGTSACLLFQLKFTIAFIVIKRQCKCN